MLCLLSLNLVTPMHQAMESTARPHTMNRPCSTSPRNLRPQLLLPHKLPMKRKPSRQYRAWTKYSTVNLHSTSQHGTAQRLNTPAASNIPLHEGV